MNNSRENLEVFCFYLFKNKRVPTIIYIKKMKAIYMNWTDVKITKEKIDDFFNSIDMDAVAKNIDAMLDQLDQEKCPDKS